MNKDVNQATNLLIKTIAKVANIHAPLVEKQVGDQKLEPPWFSPELKDAIQNKNELLTDFFQTRNISLKLKLKIECKKIARLKRNLKKAFILEKLEYKNDISKLWKLLNYLSGRQKGDKIEPECLSQKSANAHNQFFATVGLKVQEEINTHFADEVPLQTSGSTPLRFKFKNETTKSISKLFDKLKSNVATGIDTLNAKLVKDSKNTILEYLTQIINLSFETSIFPDCMKTAIISPIFKEGNPDDITNYCPISILPIISKIFERAAANQIVDFLEKKQYSQQKPTCL